MESLQASAFVYTSRFKGSYKELSALLGADLYEDMDRQLDRYIERKIHLLSDTGKRLLQALRDHISESAASLGSEVSEDQKKLHNICVDMHFKGDSLRPGFGNGAFFALESEKADEIEGAFEADELRKGDVVFSPMYADLMCALLQNASRRQNRAECIGKREQHSLAIFSKFLAACQRKDVNRDLALYEEEPSLSRVTNSTSYAPKGHSDSWTQNPEGKSWGKGVNKKTNPRKLSKSAKKIIRSVEASAEDEHLPGPAGNDDDDNDDLGDEAGSQTDDNDENDDDAELGDRHERRDDSTLQCALVEGDGRTAQDPAGTKERDQELEEGESIAPESVESLLTTADELIVPEHSLEATAEKFLTFVPQFDRLPLCKTGRAFADQVEGLMVHLETAFDLHFNTEALATLVAASPHLAFEQAKACLTSEVLGVHLARSFQRPARSTTRSLKGIARAVKESCERVAVRMSVDAMKLIDARSSKLEKQALQEDGPFATTAYLCQTIPAMIHQVLDDLNIRHIAISCWDEQEKEYKRCRKAQDNASKKSYGRDDDLKHEKLTSIAEVIEKEQSRQDNKCTMDRKGGRMHAITGPSRNGGNHRRDLQMPF